MGFRSRTGPLGSVSSNARFFETPWRRRWRHEISGLNWRNRPVTSSLRFESADGRKMERVITKTDPNSADMDLSQLEHISPIEWATLLLYLTLSD